VNIDVELMVLMLARMKAIEDALVELTGSRKKVNEIYKKSLKDVEGLVETLPEWLVPEDYY
jgi:hypothetical protein